MVQVSVLKCSECWLVVHLFVCYQMSIRNGVFTVPDKLTVSHRRHIRNNPQLLYHGNQCYLHKPMLNSIATITQL